MERRHVFGSVLPHRDFLPFTFQLQTMKTLRLCFAFSLVGCSASMVKSAGESGSAYAPVNERSQAGLVKYLNDGASFIVNRRRESAYKQMFESCRGPYRIVAEGQQAEGNTVITSDNARTEGGASSTARTTGSTTRSTTKASAETTSSSTTTLLESHYWYIQYACEAAKDSAATLK